MQLQGQAVIPFTRSAENKPNRLADVLLNLIYVAGMLNWDVRLAPKRVTQTVLPIYVASRLVLIASASL